MFRAAVAATLVLFSSTCWGATQRYDASLMGPMDGNSLASTYKEILDAPGPEVSLRIHSPGGNLLLTLLFIDLVQDAKAEKHLHITCVGTGMVASAAAIVMESPVCDVRQMEPQAVLMFHEGYLSGGGPVKADDKAFMRSLNYAVAALIAPRMGLTPEAYLSWVADGVERWLTSKLALEVGLVDRVAPWSKTVDKDAPPPL